MKFGYNWPNSSRRGVEIVDGRRTTEPTYTISSPGAFGSGELKTTTGIGEYDELLTLVKKRKLRLFGHVSRSSGLSKTILQDTIKGQRKRSRPKKR